MLLALGNRIGPYGVVGMVGDAHGHFNWEQRFALVTDAVSADCGYPSSVALPDGRVVTLYYATRAKDHPDWTVHAGAVYYRPPHRDISLTKRARPPDTLREDLREAAGMKMLLASILLLAPLAPAAEPIQNPLIDYAASAQTAAQVEPVREKHRLTEEQFAAMAAESGVVVLDARERGQVCAAAHSRGGEPAVHRFHRGIATRG